MSPPTQQTLTGHSQHSAAHHKWLALHFPKLPLDIFRCQGVPDEQVQIVIQEQRVCRDETLATAYSIRSELTYFERNPGQEQERLADLAQALYRYSSVVSLEPPDCIVLEIRGSLLLLGSADIIAQDALPLRRHEPLRHCSVGSDTSGRHCASQSPDRPPLRCAAACTGTSESGFQPAQS